MTNLEENKTSFHAQLNILYAMSKLARKIRMHKALFETSEPAFWDQKQAMLLAQYKELEDNLKEV